MVSMMAAAKKNRASKMVSGGEPLKTILAAMGPDAHRNANINPMAMSTIKAFCVLRHG